MTKTTQVRKKPLLRDSLNALRGNTHFNAFLVAMDVECGYGKTVFSAEPTQNAFNQGRQSFANDVHTNLKALERESK
tara:strand:- start:11 stop:241 length:231 start_codon:yes stop_codon:yes gene_type:complete